MKSATAAQRELVKQGKLRDKAPSSEDTQWSEGLVSAVRSAELPMLSFFLTSTPLLSHICNAGQAGSHSNQ